MRLIDIDNLKMVDDHIHYRKEYEARAVLMDNTHKIQRNPIKFSIEYRPIGAPLIDVKFTESNNNAVDKLLPKIKEKISKLDHDGILAKLHKAKKNN